MLPPDILITRCKAHLKYMSPRILKDNKREEFVETMLLIIDNIKNCEEYLLGVGFNKHDGIELAIEVFNEIVSTTDERFVSGRSGDAYFEKV